MNRNEGSAMSWLHKWIKIFLNFSILHCKHNTAQECKETVKTCCVPVFFYQAELRFKTRYFLQGISQVVSQAVQSLKSFFYLWRKFGYTYDSMWRETSVCIIFCFFLEIFNFYGNITLKMLVWSMAKVFRKLQLKNVIIKLL